jgi:hypothetical protein
MSPSFIWNEYLRQHGWGETMRALFAWGEHKPGHVFLITDFLAEHANAVCAWYEQARERR